jgi:hypothetical protein
MKKITDGAALCLFLRSGVKVAAMTLRTIAPQMILPPAFWPQQFTTTS